MLTDEQLSQVEALAARRDELEARRDEALTALTAGKKAAGALPVGTPGYYRHFETVHSLGAQIESIERRMDRLLTPPTNPESEA